jgi:broad specificity phosphatase PhoE
MMPRLRFWGTHGHRLAIVGAYAVTIYLARHAPTAANRHGLILGAGDWPLAEADLDPAHRLAKTLAEKDIRLVVSSPLSRALTTARILAGNAPVETLAGLAELSAGALEGTSRTAALPDGGAIRTAPHDRPPDGESYDDATPRVATALSHILDAEKLGPILVVGHSVVNRLFLALYWQRPVAILSGFTQPHDVILALAPGLCGWFDASGRSGPNLPQPGEKKT